MKLKTKTIRLRHAIAKTRETEEVATLDCLPDRAWFRCEPTNPSKGSPEFFSRQDSVETATKRFKEYVEERKASGWEVISQTLTKQETVF